MGKKQGQAQRTKGNAQPSSSAKAAEMLQASLGASGFSFSSEIPPIGIGTLIEDSFDSSLDPEFRVSLKKLYKKDTLTKSKALDELKNLIEAKSSEECLQILPYWSKSYTKLSLDNDRRIREQCQINHEKLCAKVTKNLAPYLKTIMPYWLLAQSDSHAPTSRFAELSFKNTFNEAKRPEVVFFARDEILNVIYDNLIVQTYKTLSDLKSVSEDEAQQKFESVICICLRGLDIFLKYYLVSFRNDSQKTNTNLSLDKLETLIMDQKFWKYSKDNSLKIRTEFYQLLSSLIDLILLNDLEQLNELKKNLKLKLIPLVFYACDEDNSSCAYFIWQSIIKCSLNMNKLDTQFWSLLNVKKAFIPKLISLLRSHANQNANSQNIEIVYSSLLPLISKLTLAFDDHKEKLLFYKDLFSKLNDSLTKETTTSLKSRSFNASKHKIIEALFECAAFVINDLVDQTDDETKQFLNLFISDNILSIFDLYLLNKLNNETDFEVKFVKLIKFVDELKSDLKKFLWSNLSSILLDKFKINNQLSEEQLDEASSNLGLLKRFTSLFQSYWLQVKSTNDSLNLLNLIKNLFAQYVTKFYLILTSDQFKSSNNEYNYLDDLGYSYLNGINLFCLNFKNDSLISSLMHNLGQDFKSFGLLIDYMVSLVKDRTNDLILFGLVDLFLIVDTSNQSKLDEYLLKSTNSLIRLDNLFSYYFKSNRSICDNANFIDWFTQSAKFNHIFVQEYLEHLDENNRFELTFEFIKFLLEKSNSNLTQIELFYDAIVKSIIQLVLKYLHSSSSENLRLNGLIEFSLKVLFYPKMSLNEQKKLWILLINSFQLKLQVLNSSSNINDLIDKLSAKLFKLIYDKASLDSDIFAQLDDYSQLIQFRNSSILNSNLSEYLQNELIVIDLIRQFDKILCQKDNAIEQFYSEVLFNFTGLSTFDQLVQKLLYFKCDLTRKLFLDTDLNYVYSANNSLILESNEQTLIDLSVLKQLNYALKILNVYFQLKNQNSTRLITILMTSHKTDLNNWWFNLILSSILVNKLELTNLFKLDDSYHLAVQLIEEIKLESNQLFYETNFSKLVLCSLNLNEFSRFLTESNMSHLSLVLFELVDKNVTNNNLHVDLTYLLNKFAYDLSNYLINESKEKEALVRHYLYDMPFAKYSIVQNLNEIKQNSSYYLDLFEKLIQSLVDKLKKTEPLDDFNFNMSLFIKYTNFYFYYLKKSNSLDQFIAKYLCDVLDVLIKQKETQTSYLIFYDDTNKNWTQFFHLDNINLFLELFFIHDQLKFNLNDKQWDFILCYSAAIAQYIDKNSTNLTRLTSTNELELFSVHYFQFLTLLIRSIQTKDHIKLNEWNGFFGKEIYDPLLNLFVKLAEFYSLEITKYAYSPYMFNMSLKSSKLKLVKTLTSIVSQMPFDRLMLNNLEPKFNVLDLSVDQNRTSIKLSDSLKSVFNHLVPHLKHEMKSFQMGSYKILSKIMNNVCTYYDLKASDDESDETNNMKHLNIFESLPHVLKDLLFELNDLFANLKTNIHFEENILVAKLEDDENQKKLNDLCHDVNRKLMSYLLINRLMLDMFTSENLEFKVKLVNDLREISFNDYLMHCLFRLMPKTASTKYFLTSDLVDDLNSNETFSNENVQLFSCQVYKHSLKCVPAMIRDWFSLQTKRVADLVDKYTTKYVSPILLEEDIVEINRSANTINLNESTSPVVDSSKKKYVFEDDEQSTIKIRGMLSTREIISTYKMKELNMELIIQLPINYPLGVVDVSSVRRLGVSENEWRNWLIQLTTYLTHQNGSIIQSLQIWKRNVDKKFSGVEECTICYNVIHGTNYQLPKKKCRTCKKLFHSICLYKWFESSSKSTCPLCRNLF